jgi:hypothetical protein
MREKGKSLILVYLATLFLVFAPAVTVQSAETPNVYVDPPTVIDDTRTPGQKFTVTVRIADATDMWSFRVDLGWCSSVLNVTDNTGTPGTVEGVTEGSFLQAGGDTTFIAYLDQAEGALSVTCSLRSGGTWQSGNGILFSVEFTVEQYGATVLGIYYSRIYVKGLPPQYLPIPTDHTSDDGFFSNVLGASYDIAVTNVTPSKTVVCQGYSAEINVTVQNQGNILQGFAVTVNYDSNSVGKKIACLSIGASANITFTWDTTDVAKGLYTMGAEASVAPGETDTGDNSYTDGTVKVTMVGDVAPEWNLIDIVDIVTVAIVFGKQKGEPGYNPNADINGDGLIDIVDIVIIAIHFGETEP